MHFIWFISSLVLILFGLSSFVKCTVREGQSLVAPAIPAYEDIDINVEDADRARRANLAKWKRAFGRNCMMTISGCFTSTQTERLRKYLENVYN